MDLVEKLQKYNRVVSHLTPVSTSSVRMTKTENIVNNFYFSLQKVCMDFLPPLYLDVHVSYITHSTNSVRVTNDSQDQRNLK